jgi:FkbM family methyltransferase
MTSRLERELDLLLAEERAAVCAREAAAFDDATGSLARSLVLFGAGGLGRKTLHGLRQAGLEPLAFADNNPALWDREIEGVKVHPPAEAARRFGGRAAFVVTIWRAGGGHRFERTQAQLAALGCPTAVPAALLFWKFPRLFLDYYCLGRPHAVVEQREEVRRAFGALSDDCSREVFVAQVRWRLQLDFAGLPAADPATQYFPPDLFMPGADDVFVDCGAFDGDTIDAFVQRRGSAFDRIIALEPDRGSFKKLRERVRQYPPAIRHRIVLHQLGVAEVSGPQRFDAEGTLSSAVNPAGQTQIECVALDDLLRDIRPTFLKMDIEGAEPAALRGARRIIRDTAPILAISAYHAPDHLWRIPRLIKSLRADYQLFLRPHNEECWDTVCYAVPPHRRTRKPETSRP